MRTFCLLVAVGLASLALTGCQDVVSLNVPTGQALLAVDGAVTDQPGPYVVTLTQTAPYLKSDALPPVTGAVLRLADNQGPAETLRERSPGVYVTSQLRGKIGHQYTLTIQTDDGQTYEAQTEIRRTMTIDSLSLKYIDKTSLRDSVGYQVVYHGQELPGTGDYSRYKIYHDGRLWNQVDDLFVVSDDLVDGNYLSFPFDRHSYRPGQRVRVEINSLTKDYYDFLREMLAQVDNHGIFAAPPANVRTNVRNTQGRAGKAAVGYFAGYAVRADSVVIR